MTKTDPRIVIANNGVMDNLRRPGHRISEDSSNEKQPRCITCAVGYYIISDYGVAGTATPENNSDTFMMSNQISFNDS